MCIIVTKFAKIGRTDPEIWPILDFQDGGCLPSLIYQKLEILTACTLLRAKVRHRTKFREDGSNRSGDMAYFRFFKMAAAAILYFRNFKFLTLKRLELRLHAKFC